MNFKELLLNGCTISHPYKKDEKSWVSSAVIHVFDGCFSRPRIYFDCPVGKEEWDLKDIDIAIEHFKKTVFNEKNLMFCAGETMREFSENEDCVDLEIESDKKRFRKIQKEKQKNSINLKKQKNEKI